MDAHNSPAAAGRASFPFVIFDHPIQKDPLLPGLTWLICRRRRELPRGKPFMPGEFKTKELMLNQNSFIKDWRVTR
jgi:hypothetical protein